MLIDFGLAHHSHYPDLLAEELRYPGRQLGLHGARAGARRALRSAQRHLRARRHSLRTRHRARCRSASPNDGATAPAALSRPRSAAGARRRPRPHGCRRSSCIASRSTPASATPPPRRSRSTSRIPPRSRSPSAGHGCAAPAGRTLFRRWMRAEEIRARAVPAAIDAGRPRADRARRTSTPRVPTRHCSRRCAMRARRLVAADDRCRIACATVGAACGHADRRTRGGHRHRPPYQASRQSAPLGKAAAVARGARDLSRARVGKAGGSAHRLREDERRRPDPDRRARAAARPRACFPASLPRSLRRRRAASPSSVRGRKAERAPQRSSDERIRKQGTALRRAVHARPAAVQLSDPGAVQRVRRRVFGVPVLYAYIFVAWAAADRADGAGGRDRPTSSGRGRACCTASVIVFDVVRLPRACCSRSPTTPTSAPTPGARSSPTPTSTACRSRSTHRVDLLRQRRARRERRRRLPADLHRPDADDRAVVGRDAQDHAHLQAEPHHLARRLHRLALRQERAARRPGHRHRGDRHPSLHLAAAEGGLEQLHDPASSIPRSSCRSERRRGADAAGHRALGGADPRRVHHRLRHAPPRRRRAPRGHGRGDRLRVAGQAARVPRRRRVRHLRHLRRLRRHLRARRGGARSCARC